MRNQKRIKQVLCLLKAIWESNPDLRFMQLIGNAVPRGDNYFVEDDAFFNWLKSYYCPDLDEVITVYEKKKVTPKKGKRQSMDSVQSVRKTKR